MRSLEVLGAAGEVTGSSFLATTNKGTTVLVNAGMHQGKEGEKHDNYRLPRNVDVVIVTHAHLDHVGHLPFLDDTTTILMTPATLSLVGIALKNSEALNPQYYPEGSVNKFLRRVTPVPYDAPFHVDSLTATLRDAGHILGSSSVKLEENCGEVTVFSGDLGNSPSRTVRPTKQIDQADLVIMESTYGNRQHPEKDPVNAIEDAVNWIIKSKGTLLIPTFAIDRTQVILNILKNLRKEHKLKNIPVFLDTPMGAEVTQKYREYRELLNDELKEQKDPFGFPGLYQIHDSRESRAIRNHQGPKIIIAGSGMMTGGRIVRHAADHLPDKNSVILFVGFTAEGTPSRAIMEGEKTILLDKDTVNIAGTVLQTSGLSAHADQSQLMEWLGNIRAGNRRLRQVVLVHGSNPAREELARKIQAELGIENVSLPAKNETMDL